MDLWKHFQLIIDNYLNNLWLENELYFLADLESMNSGENLMNNENVDGKDEDVIQQILNCANPVASTSSK